MCETRNDDIRPGDTFWAYTKVGNMRADQTGHCICDDVESWAVYATDAENLPRVFLRHIFRFEKVL